MLPCKAFSVGSPLGDHLPPPGPAPGSASHHTSPGSTAPEAPQFLLHQLLPLFLPSDNNRHKRCQRSLRFSVMGVITQHITSLTSFFPTSKLQSAAFGIPLSVSTWFLHIRLTERKTNCLPFLWMTPYATELFSRILFCAWLFTTSGSTVVLQASYSNWLGVCVAFLSQGRKALGKKKRQKKKLKCNLFDRLSCPQVKEIITTLLSGHLEIWAWEGL